MRLAPQHDDFGRIDFYRRANRADAGKAGIGGGETDSQSRHSLDRHQEGPTPLSNGGKDWSPWRHTDACV